MPLAGMPRSWSIRKAAASSACARPIGASGSRRSTRHAAPPVRSMRHGLMRARATVIAAELACGRHRRQLRACGRCGPSRHPSLPAQPLLWQRSGTVTRDRPRRGDGSAGRGRPAGDQASCRGMGCRTSTPILTCRRSMPRLTSLTRIDFAPFRALADLPMAMTAHLVFAAIDPGLPATQCAEMIELIRERDRLSRPA